MIQAARSGKQNIVETSKVSGTSKEAEIKLINVARASLEELMEDYRDFLRVRKAQLWTKDSREALFVRKLGATKEEIAEALGVAVSVNAGAAIVYSTRALDAYADSAEA